MSDKEEEYECSHDIGFTAEEEDALNWLNHSLAERSRECSPTARMSLTANNAIAKLLKKAHDLHETIHGLEFELAEAEMLVTGIAGLPQEMGVVKKEDLN